MALSLSVDPGISGTSFIRKLYEILIDVSNDAIIRWKPDGMSFEICSPKRLETEILPKFFRHSRFQSLIRQLNFYAFRKTTKERSSWVYSHDLFQRAKPELLDSLRRKTNSSYSAHPAHNEFVKSVRLPSKSHLRVSTVAFPHVSSSYSDKMDEIDEHYQNSSFYLASMSGSYFDSSSSSSSSSSTSIPIGTGFSNLGKANHFSHNPLELLSQVAALTPPGVQPLPALSSAPMTQKASRIGANIDDPAVNVHSPLASQDCGQELQSSPNHSRSYAHNGAASVTMDEDPDGGEGESGMQDGHDTATSSITMKNGDSSSNSPNNSSSEDESSSCKAASSTSSSRRDRERDKDHSGHHAQLKSQSACGGDGEAELQRLLSYFDSKMSISSKKVVMFCIIHNPWRNPAQLCIDICNLLASDFLIATEMDRHMDIFRGPICGQGLSHFKARTHAFLLRSTMLGQPLPVSFPGMELLGMSGMGMQPTNPAPFGSMSVYTHPHSLSPESYFVHGNLIAPVATSSAAGGVAAAPFTHVYTEGCQCQSCLSGARTLLQSQFSHAQAAPSDAHAGITAPPAPGFSRSTAGGNNGSTVASSLTGGTTSESDNGGGSSRDSNDNDDPTSDSPLNQEGSESDSSSGANNHTGVKNDLSYFNMQNHNAHGPNFTAGDTTGTGSDDNSLSSETGRSSPTNNNNNSPAGKTTASRKRTLGASDDPAPAKKANTTDTHTQQSFPATEETQATVDAGANVAEMATAASGLTAMAPPSQPAIQQQQQQILLQLSIEEYAKMVMAYNIQAHRDTAAATMSYVQTYKDMAFEGCDFFMLNVVEIESMKMFVPFAIDTVRTARGILADAVRRNSGESNISGGRRKLSGNEESRANSERKFLANLDACATAWSDYSRTFCV